MRDDNIQLKKIQAKQEEFIKERSWEKFSASETFTHLIEELGEVGKYVLLESGYKKPKMGSSEKKKELSREFAQVFNLLMQLAIHFDVNLEDAWKDEIEIMEKRFDKKSWKEYSDSKFKD